MSTLWELKQLLDQFYKNDIIIELTAGEKITGRALIINMDPFSIYTNSGAFQFDYSEITGVNIIGQSVSGDPMLCNLRQLEDELSPGEQDKSNTCAQSVSVNRAINICADALLHAQQRIEKAKTTMMK